MTTIRLNGEKFIHCTVCVDQNLPGALSVGITAMADLVITCNRHDQVVAYFENGKITSQLREITAAGCDNPNCKHGHEVGN